jgi:hypothetical protein
MNKEELQKLLNFVNVLDQAAGLAPLNRIDHINLQNAASELRNHFNRQIVLLPIEPKPKDTE